jgi:hypothetical protein
MGLAPVGVRHLPSAAVGGVDQWISCSPLLLELSHPALPVPQLTALKCLFLVQLAFFAAYSGLVTYTLATKWQAGALPALLFAVAMGLHIFATDHVLAEHFPVRLTGRWRFVLAGGALTGWLVAIAVQPTGTPLINTLTAFLGGAILLNVFIDELPPERHSSFGWFVVGLVAYALLLIFVTVTGKPGAA